MRDFVLATLLCSRLIRVSSELWLSSFGWHIGDGPCCLCFISFFAFNLLLTCIARASSLCTRITLIVFRLAALAFYAVDSLIMLGSYDSSTVVVCAYACLVKTWLGLFTYASITTTPLSLLIFMYFWVFL